MTSGFSSTCENLMTRHHSTTAFCMSLFLSNVHRWTVLLLANYDSGVPFKCAFCCEAAIRAVNSLCCPLLGASWISYASQYSVRVVGDFTKPEMLTKGKFGAGKLQTSKVAFIASRHHHPKLICQLGLSCSLELASCLLVTLVF